MIALKTVLSGNKPNLPTKNAIFNTENYKTYWENERRSK